MLGKHVIGDEFTRITGLATDISYPSGGGIELVPRAHDPKATFLVRASQHQRKLSIVFEPGTFAGDLVHAMGLVDETGRTLWLAQVEDLTRLRCSVRMSVNGSPVEPATPAAWPTDWRFLILELSRNLVALDAADLEDGLLPASYWIARFAALLVALLPLETSEAEQFEPDVEGDPRFTLHLRYERSARNRQAAIALQGYECKGCEINMERVYGTLGREFIHIHHVTPLSELDLPRPIDPAKDLVPLCPNCHAIVHRRRPPYTLAELRQALGRS